MAAIDPAEDLSTDQVAARHPAHFDDRLPTPIVYQPISGSSVGEVQSQRPESKAKNTPAGWSLVLVVLALAGGVAVVGWLAEFDPGTAGMVSLVSLGLAAAALFLAIGGLVIAGQRSTKRRMSVIMLVVSTLLVIWLAVVAAGQALAILA